MICFQGLELLLQILCCSDVTKSSVLDSIYLKHWSRWRCKRAGISLCCCYSISYQMMWFAFGAHKTPFFVVSDFINLLLVFSSATSSSPLVSEWAMLYYLNVWFSVSKCILYHLSHHLNVSCRVWGLQKISPMWLAGESLSQTGN